MNIEDKTCTNENDSNHTYKSIIPELILFYLCASVILFSPFRCFVIFTLFSTFIVPPRFPRPPKYMLFRKTGEKKIMTRTIKSAFEINKPKTQSKDLVTKIFPIYRSSLQIFQIIYLFNEKINKHLCLVALSLPLFASKVYFSFILKT